MGRQMTDREVPPDLVAEARNTPGGWVYEIVGDFGPNEKFVEPADRRSGGFLNRAGRWLNR